MANFSDIRGLLKIEDEIEATKTADTNILGTALADRIMAIIIATILINLIILMAVTNAPAAENRKSLWSKKRR